MGKKKKKTKDFYHCFFFFTIKNNVFLSPVFFSVLLSSIIYDLYVL